MLYDLQPAPTVGAAPVSKLNVMQRVKNGFHIRHVPRDARDVASNCAPPRLSVPNAVKIVVLCSAPSIFTIRPLLGPSPG